MRRFIEDEKRTDFSVMGILPGGYIPPRQSFSFSRSTVVPAFFFYMFKGILQYTPTSRVLKIRGDCAGEWTG
jgi:hypothetical protein